MTKAAELAKMGEVLTNSQLGGRRNMVINGAMQVAQRGTSSSFSTSTEGFIITDRFAFSMNGTSTVYTASQDTTAPDGFTKSIKLDCTTADSSLSAGDFTQIHYKIEGQDLQLLKKGTSSAEKVTISFYVRSPKTGTHILEIQDRDNTRSISKSYTINTADTFEYKQITFDGDTSGALNDDNGESFRLTWWLQAGSTYTSGTLATSWEATTSANRAVGQVNIGDNVANNFFITGIQLEVGSQATPFEYRSYGEELALCQRYYHRISRGSGASSPVSVGFHTGTQHRGLVHFTTAMRSSPTVDKSSLSDINVYHGGGIVNPTAISNEGVSDASITAVRFAANSGGASNGDATIIQLDADSFIDFDSEL
jgi:hypothetical protein